MKTVIYFLNEVAGTCCMLLLAVTLQAQPFVDPFQVRYTYGFRNNNAAATPFTHFWAGSDLPLKLKEKTYLMLSPFYEQWAIDSAGKHEIFPTVKSIAFAAGLVLPFKNTKWSLTVLPVMRFNGEHLFKEKTFQFGGTSFVTYARKPQQKFRLGVYVNTEFFGFFVMPLLGADWRIDEKNYLFGLLPGRITYEHQWNKKLYWGATFRAITNSYRLSNSQYLRLDDNQLSLYFDYYLAKKICFTLESGYGIFRKMRTGINYRDYLINRNWGDGPFIKLSASYRIRL